MKVRALAVILVLASQVVAADPSKYFHESGATPWYLGRGPITAPAGASGPASFAPLAKRVKPAVVNISTTIKLKPQKQMNPFQQFGGSPFGGPRMGPRGGQQDPFDEFFEKYFDGSPQQEREQHSLGSGFIINEDGYILTNNHVIEKADEIIVRLSDKHKYKAKIVGSDPKTDVAVIKIDDGDSKLPFVALGNSDVAEVGDWVLAIGNPFGLEQTVTAGIISAKGRVIGAGPYDSFIQTDASINPGNSGGPLFNMNGEVIGINTAIFASGQGLGFAIPINMAKKLIPQLITHGKVTDRGWLGVMIQPVTEELAKSFGLSGEGGALVGDVVKGSPAEKAGVKRGDVILSFNGEKIDVANELPALVATTPAGKAAILSVLRDGKKMDLTVTLGNQKDDKEEIAEAPKDKAPGNPDKLGFAVKGSNAGEGVVITQIDPDSAAAIAGVRPGDTLVEINGVAIKDMTAYTEQVNKLSKGSMVRLLIAREGTTIYVAFPLNK